MQELYGPQVNPLVRVVQGVPISWDISIASVRFPGHVETVVWSPCSKFIAIAWYSLSDIGILDAMTLG